VSEALNLRRNDLSFREKTIRILESKNHKDRLVVMDDSLCRHLSSYVAKVAPASEQFIFRKDNGEEVTPALVYSWFRHFIDKAGIEHKGKGYGPRVHDFRHTFAVLSLNKLLEEGKPLYTALPILKDFLGHHDIKSTEGYVRFAQWMMPDVIKSMNAISEKIIPSLEDTNESQVV
jgi:integrase